MTATAELDPLLTTDFIQEMVKQMRAIDSYGTYDGWPAERVLLKSLDVRDSEVVLKVDESSNVKVRFNRAAIKEVMRDAGAKPAGDGK